MDKDKTLTQLHSDLLEKLDNLADLLHSVKKTWDDLVEQRRIKTKYIRDILVQLSSKIVPDGVRIPLLTIDRYHFILTSQGIRYVPPFCVNSLELGSSRGIKLIAKNLLGEELERLLYQQLSAKNIPLTSLRTKRIKTLIEYVKAINKLDWRDWEKNDPLELDLVPPREYFLGNKKKIVTFIQISLDLGITLEIRDNTDFLCRFPDNRYEILFLLTPSELERVIEWIQTEWMSHLEKNVELFDQIVNEYGHYIINEIL